MMDPAALSGLLASSRRRVQAATDMVQRHLADAPESYVSWSGGKDSTAVALLATEADPAIPVVRCSHGVDYPEVVEYCAELAARMGWDYRVATLDRDAYLARVGVVEDDNGSYDDDVATVGISRDAGLLWGLRADESLHRRILLARHRGQFRRATGRLVSAPVWQWSRSDVMAYLTRRGVALCPVYARLDALGCPERDQRVGFLVGGGGALTGRYYWLRRGWPDEWRELCDRLPWLREWA